jgi:hypothetical protein
MILVLKAQGLWGEKLSLRVPCLISKAFPAKRYPKPVKNLRFL